MSADDGKHRNQQVALVHSVWTASRFKQENAKERKVGPPENPDGGYAEYSWLIPGPEAGIHGHGFDKGGVGANDGCGSQRHEPSAQAQQLRCQVPRRVDNDGPDDNDEHGDVAHEKAEGRTIAIKVVQENTTFFGNPAGSGNKDEPGKKVSGLGLSKSPGNDIDSDYTESSQFQEQHGYNPVPGSSAITHRWYMNSRAAPIHVILIQSLDEIPRRRARLYTTN